jgi:hypothetical protein
MAFNAKDIIVGAANILVGDPGTDLPAPATDASYATTLEAETGSVWRNVGYTSNGLEIQFAPEFGEVQVDQLLDSAKLFKSGMTVTLNTSLSEATLENLAFALAVNEDKYLNTSGTNTEIELDSGTQSATATWSAYTGTVKVMDLASGSLGECPTERQLVAVGPGPGQECIGEVVSERVYTAFRVLNVESVTISAKRDEATLYDVSLRLLPNSAGLYGQIVDRDWHNPAA